MDELDEIIERMKLAEETGPAIATHNKLYLFYDLLRIATEQREQIRELRDKVATYIEDARYYRHHWRSEAEWNVEAVKQIRELREALELYANPFSYETGCDGIGPEHAQAALAKYRGDT